MADDETKHVTPANDRGATTKHKKRGSTSGTENYGSVEKQEGDEASSGGQDHPKL